jgi:hypothetical protein
VSPQLGKSRRIVFIGSDNLHATVTAETGSHPFHPAHLIAGVADVT